MYLKFEYVNIHTNNKGYKIHILLISLQSNTNIVIGSYLNNDKLK